MRRCGVCRRPLQSDIDGTSDLCRDCRNDQKKMNEHAAELVIKRIVEKLDEIEPEGVWPEKVEMAIDSLVDEVKELRIIVATPPTPKEIETVIVDLREQINFFRVQVDDLQSANTREVLRRREAEALLGQAALAIPEVAGPVHERIRILRESWSELSNQAGQLLNRALLCALPNGKRRDRYESFVEVIHGSTEMEALVTWLWERRSQQDGKANT